MKHQLDFRMAVSRAGSHITSECAGPGLLDDVRETIWRRVLDAEDQAVRQKLIELGWAPPGAVEAEREACAQACEAIEDEYHRTEGRRYPELKSDAETGACHCAAAIRALGST